MKKTPFSAKELNEFRQILLEKRERVLKGIKDQAEELTEEKDESGDLVDKATNVLERNINLSLTHTEQEIIEDIDEALERIKNKTYGICIDTDIPIAKTRLKAIPEAKRCLESQERFDKLKASRLGKLKTSPP